MARKLNLPEGETKFQTDFSTYSLGNSIRKVYIEIEISKRWFGKYYEH